MADFVATPPAVNGIPVRGGHGQFPMRRVYCVGHNYAAHAREMGSDPDCEPLFFLCKPADAVRYVTDGEVGQFVYLTETKDCHYKIELVVVIGMDGRDIVVETAAHHVYDHTIGLDMTRRGLQNAAKKDGRPWEIGEALNDSAPIGPIMPARDIAHPDRGAVMLSVNGRKHQRGDLSNLIWSVSEAIAYLSRLLELRLGDLVYIGTPEGAGPVVIGNLTVGKIDGMGELYVRVI